MDHSLPGSSALGILPERILEWGLRKVEGGLLVKVKRPTTICTCHFELDFLGYLREPALNLWSGSTDSKTLDCQRTNPSEYQIVRTPTMETIRIQDLASPNHQ